MIERAPPGEDAAGAKARLHKVGMVGCCCYGRLGGDSMLPQHPQPHRRFDHRRHLFLMLGTYSRLRSRSRVQPEFMAPTSPQEIPLSRIPSPPPKSKLERAQPRPTKSRWTAYLALAPSMGRKGLLTARTLPLTSQLVDLRPSLQISMRTSTVALNGLGSGGLSTSKILALLRAPLGCLTVFD